MASSLNEIKRKIAATEATSKITGAMQMVSAAKLGKSEQATKNFSTYISKLDQIVVDLLSGFGTEGVNSPFFLSRPVKKTAYIVITSDKGLVGGYNSTVLKSVMTMIHEEHNDNHDEYVIIALGSMGADFFKARGMNVIFEKRGLKDHPSYEEVHKILNRSVEMFKNEIFDELYICYQHYINSITSNVRVEKVLPITHLDLSSARHDAASFELEPGREDLLEGVVPFYAESMIYGIILDAKTAEHAAGMTAMQTATDNAHNLVSDLTIAYNRARQAAITQEITEIVGGANALD